MKYTVNRGSQEIGKFELADIKALMNAGVILPTDYFWFQGMSEWKPVSTLFAQQVSMAPQVVVPPLPTTRTESTGHVVMTQQIGPSCPSCYSTDVIKAYAAYEASLQQHSLAAGTSSGFRLWAGGETINKVGIKCAPPIKPERIDGVGTERMLTLLSAIVGVTCTTLGAFLVMEVRGAGAGLLAVGIGSSVAFYFFYKTWKANEAVAEAQHQSTLQQYKANLADYARTWRCNKCGVMYMP